MDRPVLDLSRRSTASSEGGITRLTEQAVEQKNACWQFEQGLSGGLARYPVNQNIRSARRTARPQRPKGGGREQRREGEVGETHLGDHSPCTCDRPRQA